MSKPLEKHMKYAYALTQALASVFDEDSDYHISTEELQEDDNATEFAHALLNLAPGVVYNNLTGNDHNLLETNHVANRLIFQFKNNKDGKTENDQTGT